MKIFVSVLMFNVLIGCANTSSKTILMKDNFEVSLAELEYDAGLCEVRYENYVKTAQSMGYEIQSKQQRMRSCFGSMGYRSVEKKDNKERFVNLSLKDIELNLIKIGK